MSHITSSTGLLLPVEAICKKARELGIPCFIDGAHAPGQVLVDLRGLEVDYYAGACHKWMLAPKGCSFLYTRPDRQEALDPLVISWGYDSITPSASKYLDYHEGQGTRDYSAFLTVPACVKFMDEHRWTEVARGCRELVRKNAPQFSQLLGCSSLAPLTDEFLVQMLSLPVKSTNPEALQLHLFREYRIEIPVMRHGDNVYIRFSINAFNTQEDLDKLFAALKETADRTGLLTC